MSDRWVFGLAVATAWAAWLGRSVPWLVVVVLLVAALLVRRPVLMLVATAALASALSAQARAGLQPVNNESVASIVTLLNDPESIGSGQRARVRLGTRHVEVMARGIPARKLAPLLAGDRVWLEGTLNSVDGPVGVRLANRHVVGRVDATVVGDQVDGAPILRSANRVRRLIERGARVMSPAERALFTGFVLGDDRAEPAEIVADFNASGLSHLTAVSGENVAFVLIAAGPLLRRLTIRWRWFATCAVVAWFCMLTRFEPSVLRAGAMATLAVSSWALARPASVVRLLALAATVMMLLDPFLVHSMGWWLSVGATLGIGTLSGPITERLPGPLGLREAIGVTAAAQVGVAPVQIAVFGGLPLVSIPANLLAVPAAGPVMVWGLPAGLLAGVVPQSVAMVLHAPSRLCIRWIALVARLAARVPLGSLGWPHLAVIVLAVGLRVVGGRSLVARAAIAGLSGLVVVSSVVSALPRAPSGFARYGDTVRVWHLEGVTVVSVDGRTPRLLDVLRTAKVNRIDVLVTTTRAADIEAVARSFGPSLVLTTANAPGNYPVGPLQIVVTSAGTGIEIDVSATDRGPPSLGAVASRRHDIAVHR